MTEKIILIGGGGHCEDIIETLRLNKIYDPIGILDLQEKIGNKILGVPIIGHDIDMEKIRQQNVNHCFIAVGAVGKPLIRVRLYKSAKNLNFSFPNIIHPSALLASSAIMGDGNYIGPNTVVHASVKIGNCTIINSGSIIEHHCEIGNFVHIAPGVTLSGGVVVGDKTHIGTGACSIQYVKIGENTTIGVGSVVVKHIESNVVAFGNPCRSRRNQK